MSAYAKDYKDVTIYPLDPPREMELRAAHKECTSPIKGLAVIHDKANRKIKDWLYQALAEKLYRDQGPAKVKQFVAFLDSPHRVVGEFIPTKKIVYDGDKMAAATPAVEGGF